MSIIEDIVERGAVEYGITLPSAARPAFEKYYYYLEEWGRERNLTAIEGKEDIARLHFLDSMALLNTVSFKNAAVIDIGSGAGFPGLPIKLAEPTIELTLLDATRKRVDFLSSLCAELGLATVSCIHARAEEAALTSDFRECFDIALSRAVARLNILCELCLPFVQLGGVFIAMKGIESEKEAAEASNAIETLGAGLERVYDYQIPGTEIVHRAVLIRKTSETPDGYPRRFAKIQKRPL